MVVGLPLGKPEDDLDPYAEKLAEFRLHVGDERQAGEVGVRRVVFTRCPVPATVPPNRPRCCAPESEQVRWPAW